MIFQVNGICGNLNDIPEDDRLMQNGAQAITDDEFINSYSAIPGNDMQTCGRSRQLTFNRPLKIVKNNNRKTYLCT